MPSYCRMNPGVYKFANDFEPIEPCDLKLLGALACRYTWSPIVFQDNYRAKKNFRYSAFTGFDVDNTETEIYTVEQAIEDWCDSAVIIASTRSHMKPKVSGGVEHPPAPRFRIITPWERVITSLDEYEYNMRRIVQNSEPFDGSCVDGARPFYPCTKILYANFDGFKQPVTPYEKPTVSLQDAVKLYVNNKSNKIRYKVDNFIKNGIPFDGGRNDSVYQSTLELLDKGTPAKKVLELLRESPFDRREFSDHELERTYRSAVNRFVQKHKKN
jgi:hypothetical protein